MLTSKYDRLSTSNNYKIWTKYLGGKTLFEGTKE